MHSILTPSVVVFFKMVRFNLRNPSKSGLFNIKVSIKKKKPQKKQTNYFFFLRVLSATRSSVRATLHGSSFSAYFLNKNAQFV